MTSQEFNNLTPNERARVILQTAHYLSTIEYYDYTVNLYSLSNFFIEVRLAAVTKDVESIRVIKGEELDRFVNRIELPLL